MVDLVGVLVREGWNLVDDVQVLSGDSLWQSQNKDKRRRHVRLVSVYLV